MDLTRSRIKHLCLMRGIDLGIEMVDRGKTWGYKPSFKTRFGGEKLTVVGTHPKNEKDLQALFRTDFVLVDSVGTSYYYIDGHFVDSLQMGNA